MKTPSLFAVASMVAILFGLPSLAYARLENPAVRSEPLAEMTNANLLLKFSQRVMVQKTTVEIRNSHGALIETGNLQTDKTGTELQIPLTAPLRPDIYTIQWRAVSVHGVVDGGGYSFTVESSFSHVPDIAQQ